MTAHLRFTDPRTEPPGGYRYKDPNTGYLSIGGTLAICIKNAEDHRRANDLAIPEDFAFQVETWICRQVGGRWCMDRRPVAVPASEPKQSLLRRVISSAALGLEVVRNGSQAMFKLMSTANYVDAARAQNRAKICAACPLNRASSACTSCGGLDGTVTKLVGQTKNFLVSKEHLGTAKDLMVCAACKCMLKGKVWLKYPIIRKLTSQATFDSLPDACWIKREAPDP